MHTLGKFCDSTAKAVLQDLAILVKCYTARLMLDEGAISYAEYQGLIDDFLAGATQNRCSAKVVAKFRVYEEDYVRREDAIRAEKVALVVDAYAKGMLASKLDAVGVEIVSPAVSATADVFRGEPASRGAAKGVAHVFPKVRPQTDDGVILVVDAHVFSPDHIDLLRNASAVVTCNCGMTGHIPLMCRAYKKGCVILNKEDIGQIRNGDPIIACGSTGIVATGLMADGRVGTN